MKFSKLANAIGDRLLDRLVPRTTASARPDCWVDSQVRSCGVGKYWLCKRSCCYLSGCGAWSCSGCTTM